jgi:hypothetical protein
MERFFSNSAPSHVARDGHGTGEKVRADAIGCRPFAVSDAEMEIFIDTWR